MASKTEIDQSTKIWKIKHFVQSNGKVITGKRTFGRIFRTILIFDVILSADTY